MNNEVEVVEDNKLVELVSESNALTVFLAEHGTQPYLDLVRQEIDNFEADVRTSKGKKAIVTMAAKISKIKTAWDNLGKEEVAKLKEQPKIIDAERKRMRDTLDAWKDEVRKPLTDFEEAEKKRVHHIKDRIALLSYIPTAILSIEDIEILIAEKEDVNVDGSFSEFQKDAELEKLKTIDVLRKKLVVLQEREKEEKQKKLKALEEQREREKRLIKEAEERAKAEAEAKAAKQIEDAKRAELYAIHLAEEAERRVAEINIREQQAEEKREKEKQEALALAKAEKKKAITDAIYYEPNIIPITKSVIDVSEKHINEAIDSLVDLGIDRPTACDIIDFIDSGLIAHVKFVPNETLPF
jgi:septal ring factor EnvC (AmiA/AmiB activator)